MAASLRIRRVYLAALEEGRVRELPAPAYVLGFVRTYSRALGLDDDDMVRRFREANAATPTRRVDLVFPEPVPERGIPAGAVVLAGVVLVVGAYLAWFQWSGSGTRTVDTVPAMPARLEQLAREAAPAVPPAGLGNLPQAGNALLSGTMPPPGPAPFGQVVRQAPPGPPAAIAATAPLAPTAPWVAPAADEPRILLRAKADSWVSLRERATGQSLVSRMLRTGDILPIPAREGLVLTIGNAAATEFVVDGLPTPAFPANTAVKRDIPMDPDRLKAGQYSAVGAAANGAAPRPAPAPRPARPEDRAYEPAQ